jgi:hypothetical protein
MTEGRGQKAEDREFGMRKSECGSWKTQTGDGRQKTEIRGQKTDGGILIMCFVTIILSSDLCLLKEFGEKR